SSSASARCRGPGRGGSRVPLVRTGRTHTRQFRPRRRTADRDPGGRTHEEQEARDPTTAARGGRGAPRLSQRKAGRPLWSGTWADRSADMLKGDLAAAGIPYAVDGPHGLLYADFHALRHSFITLLERSGVSPKTAQELARHSDIRLTMQRYTHKTLHDLGA